MIDTYSDSLQIISISMDNKRDDWSASVKQDSVDWPSLWSNEQLESKIVSIPYQVWSYPTFIIIDPQGKVIQRWVGYSSGMFEEKIGWLKNKSHH